ncbi:MAG TPA: shikimate dehydrogenase [Anaeromyxobacteraceae bacterium]|nr:shikimate dehydrogenase [Anaeromyxobacteraceae bacterium]
MISGRTALYGVLGHPVAHSLSPAMHNAAFPALGIDAAYLALDVRPEALAEAVRGAHALGFQGLNVTVPHKEKALGLCARVEAAARLVGAVNTLKRFPDGWEGHNTDAPAFRELLAEAGWAKGARALVLGAGGAARAAAWAVLELSGTVRVAARRPEAALAVCHGMARALGKPGAAAEPAPWADAVHEAERADLVVNATSVGLAGKAGELPPLRWRAGQLCADFVYGDTAFARAAASAGARLVAGERILLRQGALALRIWTGRAAPEEAMAKALRGGR